MYPCVLSYLCTCIWGCCMASYYMHLSLQRGQTPLMVAKGHVECVQLLLGRGAQANGQDKVSDEISVCYCHVPLCEEAIV